MKYQAAVVQSVIITDSVMQMDFASKIAAAVGVPVSSVGSAVSAASASTRSPTKAKVKSNKKM